jgi:hypothetical protein
MICSLRLLTSPLSGKRCGRAIPEPRMPPLAIVKDLPLQTFVDSVPLAKEKMLAA